IHTFDTSATGVQHTHNVTHVLFRNRNFNFHDWLKKNSLTFVFSCFQSHGTSGLKRHFTGVNIVVRTVDDCSFNVYKREACKNSVLHSFYDTLLCRSNILPRYRTTDDFAVELVTRTSFQRFEFNPNVTVLSTTTGLTYELTFYARRC